MHIRLADPDRDPADVAAIYRPSVEDRARQLRGGRTRRGRDGWTDAKDLARTPWLVAEDDDGAVVGYAYAGAHHERPGYRWAVKSR